VAVLTVFAGPNGSGKSSIIAPGEFEGKEDLLEADAIARRINPELPAQAALSAGREVLRRAKRHVERQESFSIETTLSGNWTSSVIRDALEHGFFFRLVYICLDNPERSIQRVRERVARGGHDVPDKDVRRRYARSLVNAEKMLRVAHQSLVFDNSGKAPVLLFEAREGIILRMERNLPAWAVGLV
jgi:predicted ABC-type ATPase